jgi:hypothetical protein
MAFPRLTITIAIVSAFAAIGSALVAWYAVKSTEYRPVNELVGADWHCFGKCPKDERDRIEIAVPGESFITVGIADGSPQSNAVYDVNTGVIECVGSLDPDKRTDGCLLHGQVSHNGKGIVWRKAGAAENNLTAWYRTDEARSGQ